MNGLPERRIDVQFDDNRLLPMLYGEHDRHLARIETLLGVSLISRGNTLTISGPSEAAETARTALNGLYGRLTRGQTIDGGEVDGAVRMATAEAGFAGVAAGGVSGGEEPRAPGPQATITRAEIALRTRRRGPITPRTPTQAAYLQALAESELVFGLGPAGTGKTYLAVAQAVALLTTGQVDRIVLSRPAVEAGERLGFLPGDLKEKVDPYLRPLYDALHDMLPAEQVKKRLESGEIEIAPLAFMRGRTLGNAFVILDEAQNTTPMQMKMFLTRLGEGGRMVVTGDISQIDLPTGTRSGLRDALDILGGVEGVRFVRFTDADVVRHPMVARIIRAYDQADAREAERRQARRTNAAPAGSAAETTGRDAGIVGEPE